MKTNKRWLYRSAGTVLAAFAAGPVMAGDGTGIVGSPHDFATDSWNFRGEICRVCHVPHDHGRNNAILAGGLMWNHALSAATYTLYNNAWSGTIDGMQSAQPDGTAKLCLGCHDGTVALDEFDSRIGAPPPGATFLDGSVMIPGLVDGTNLDLRATHPISITYDPVADPNLNPTTTTMGTSGTIESVLDAGKVQCSSCHDVHDQEAVEGTLLLRVAQTTTEGGTASGLCLTCHVK